MGGQDLSEIPTEELVHEVQRRLECLNKPEKRLILIGELQEARILQLRHAVGVNTAPGAPTARLPSGSDVHSASTAPRPPDRQRFPRAACRACWGRGPAPHRACRTLPQVPLAPARAPRAR